MTAARDQPAAIARRDLINVNMPNGVAVASRRQHSAPAGWREPPGARQVRPRLIEGAPTRQITVAPEAIAKSKAGPSFVSGVVSSPHYVLSSRRPIPTISAAIAMHQGGIRGSRAFGLHGNPWRFCGQSLVDPGSAMARNRAITQALARDLLRSLPDSITTGNSKCAK